MPTPRQMLESWLSGGSEHTIPAAYSGSIDEGVTHQAFRFDHNHGALVMIDSDAYEAHEGHRFYITGHAILANEAVLRIKLVVPNTEVRIHLGWAISSSGILQADLYENASGGMAGGSGVTIFNSDRNSDKVSAVSLTSGVAAADTAGTLIDTAKWGANDKKAQLGGGQTRADLVILKQGATYLRVFTSGTADNIVQFKASWIEHAPEYS